MGREVAVTASALAALVCSASLVGGANLQHQYQSRTVKKASEIDRPNRQRIKICALSAVSLVNGQITSLDIEWQSRRMRLDPPNFTVVPARILPEVGYSKSRYDAHRAAMLRASSKSRRRAAGSPIA